MRYAGGKGSDWLSQWHFGELKHAEPWNICSRTAANNLEHDEGGQAYVMCSRKLPVTQSVCAAEDYLPVLVNSRAHCIHAGKTVADIAGGLCEVFAHLQRIQTTVNNRADGVLVGVFQNTQRVQNPKLDGKSVKHSVFSRKFFD